MYFDIETGPLPEDQLSKLMPEFEPDPRLKDPDKIKASIESKKESWISECALRADMGQILAIGYAIDDSKTVILHGRESDLLNDFDDLIFHAIQSEAIICGFNILGFDLPFIRRRHLIYGMPITWHSSKNKWEPWKFRTYDAMQDWLSGNPRDSISLDALAKALGFAGKTGKGSDFHKLYSDVSTRNKAIDYLKNDIKQTKLICDALLKCGGAL